MGIVKRGKSYGARIHVGHGKYIWVGTFSTRRDAKEAVRQAESKRHVRGSEACDSFAERWPQDYARPEASTNRTNREVLKPFIKNFRGRRLTDIRRPEARAWANEHRRAARVVRTMYNDALNDGLVVENPFSKLGLPEPRGRRDIKPLTAGEVQELAATAERIYGEYGKSFGAAIVFAAYVGLRPGELGAIRWEDVDGDVVRIERQLRTDGFHLPKFGNTRSVYLPPQAQAALSNISRLKDDPFIFTSKRGRRLSKSNLYYVWNPVRCAAGMPEMDFYELRHFCGSELGRMGITAFDIAAQLGHKDGGKTAMKYYVHTPEEEAQERLRNAFGNVVPLGKAGRTESAS